MTFYDGFFTLPKRMESYIKFRDIKFTVHLYRIHVHARMPIEIFKYTVRINDKKASFINLD